MANAVLFAGCRSVVERVAHLLLKVSERLNETNIPLTHEDIARALGVRRSGVTNALHVIEGERAIRSQRSLTIITDRNRLEFLSTQPPSVPPRERSSKQ